MPGKIENWQISRLNGYLMQYLALGVDRLGCFWYNNGMFVWSFVFFNFSGRLAGFWIIGLNFFEEI